MTNNQNAVGVIPARFQVPALHAGHRGLLDFVRANHRDYLVVLGTRPGFPSPDYELSYEARAGMVQEAFPDANVAKLFDHPISSKYWSRDLDAVIESRYPGRPAVLYGSRKSFAREYSGKFPVVEAPTFGNHNGTEVRNGIKLKMSEETRCALIHQVRKREPIVYRAVDLAIVDRPRDRVLMIKKNIHEGYISFMGGFDNVKGQTDEEAVLREKDEELPGLRIGKIVNIGNMPIDDPRYRNTTDGVKTTFFRTTYRGGNFVAADDADGYEWCPRSELLERSVPWHRPLGELLLRRWDR